MNDWHGIGARIQGMLRLIRQRTVLAFALGGLMGIGLGGLTFFEDSVCQTPEGSEWTPSAMQWEQLLHQVTRLHAVQTDAAWLARLDDWFTLQVAAPLTAMQQSQQRVLAALEALPPTLETATPGVPPALGFDVLGMEVWNDRLGVRVLDTTSGAVALVGVGERYAHWQLKAVDVEHHTATFEHTEDFVVRVISL